MDINNLTREEALELHYEMWTDMQRDLGDNPGADARDEYKSEWCDEYFPNYIVSYNCFLCEYGEQQSREALGTSARRCRFCPIDWSSLTAFEYADKPFTCFRRYMGRTNTYIYEDAPISEILALPERK